MKTTKKQNAIYLAFMLLACGGALVWQLFLPWMGDAFTSWGGAAGWQREIALWNVGLIAAIALSLLKKDAALMRLMVLQSTVLCWALGLNHLVALVQDFSWSYGIHILGVLEVLFLGGAWGTVLLLRGREKHH